MKMKESDRGRMKRGEKEVMEQESSKERIGEK